MKRLLTFALIAFLIPLPCRGAQPPEEDEETKKLREDSAKLLEEARKLDELVKLKTEITRLKEEIKRLKDEMAGVKPPPPPPPPPPALPIPRDRWDLASLSAALPLKVTSMTLRENNEVGITLEFTQNMDPREAQLLDRGLRGDRSFIAFWFVDREGVVLETRNRFLFEGEILGRKGEAFRLLVKLPNEETAKKVSRVEIRRGY